MTTENQTEPGRPVDYTPEIGSTICDRLMEGETLREICTDPAMPDKPTVVRRLAQHDEFYDEYAFTRQLQAQELADEACSIAAGARAPYLLPLAAMEVRAELAARRKLAGLKHPSNPPRTRRTEELAMAELPMADDEPKTTQRTGCSPDRPGQSEYTEEIGDMICGHLAEEESLRSICSLPGMPNLDTLRSWILHNPTFRQSYALAREFQAHCISDDTIDLADDASSDQVEQVRPDGRVVTVADPNNLTRCRLRIEVRQWVATGLLARARQLSARTLFGPSLPRSPTL